MNQKLKTKQSTKKWFHGINNGREASMVRSGTSQQISDWIHDYYHSLRLDCSRFDAI